MLDAKLPTIRGMSVPAFAVDASAAGAALGQGFFMGAGLIMAIGAQNALVLRQGLARKHVGPTVLLCVLSDWLLIVAGVYGLGSLISASPTALEWLRWGGAAFLVWYGVVALRRAIAPVHGSLQAAGAVSSLRDTLMAAAAMTYLNPHVYLDTVVLLGSVGAQHRGDARAAFAAGAGLASLAWFAALGYGAAAAAPWLQRPQVWRTIDAVVAAVMFFVAWQLLARPLM